MAPSVPPIGSLAPLVAMAAAVLVVACTSGGDGARLAIGPTQPDATLTATTGPPTTPVSASVAPGSDGDPDSGDEPGAGEARPAPAWLGQRTLPTTPEGRVVVPQTTPTELVDRQLVSVDHLAPPDGPAFAATIGPVGDDILARSTWRPGCPVEPDELAYVTVTFWGFDDRPHTGELLVDATAADDLVTVFARLYEARFPIEEMRIVTQADLDAPPTGDGNNTTSFVCRPVTGGTSFSEHAYGLAVDVNPFHNPYRRDDLVLPELAASYLDRTSDRPGMITDGDVVVEAFADIGWTWGGDWRSLEDYHHFSARGR